MNTEQILSDAEIETFAQRIREPSRCLPLEASAAIFCVVEQAREANRLREKLAEVTAEAECYRKQLLLFASDPESVKIEWKQATGQIVAQVEHWAARLFAISFLESLGDAPNFVTMDLGPIIAGGPVVEITIKRKDGRSPAEVIGELRPDAERYRFLRDHTQRCESPHMDGTHEWSTRFLPMGRHRTFDAAVDATMERVHADK